MRGGRGLVDEFGTSQDYYREVCGSSVWSPAAALACGTARIRYVGAGRACAPRDGDADGGRMRCSSVSVNELPLIPALRYIYNFGFLS